MFYPNSEEPMDVATYQAQVAPSQDEEEVLLTLSLKWSWFDQPQGQKNFLEQCLQTWFNKRKAKVNCSVKRTVGDGSFVIKIQPLPALRDLQKLTGETLTKRGGKAKVTILSVSLGSTRMDAQTLDHVSANPLSVFDDKACPRKRNRPFSAAEANSSLDGVSEQSCLVSVDHFGYINHIYKEEIKQIEKKNKSHILVHVFESDQTDGRPNEALSDFTKLVQKHSADSRGSVIPLKFVDPDQWSEALKIIQKKKNKLFLTLSSEEMIVYGSSQSKEAFSETLNSTQQTNTPSYTPKETKPASQNTSLTTDMFDWNTVLTTKPFMKENCNITSAKIKIKSDLNLKESSFKKSDIKSSSKNSGGTCSSLTSTQLYGATGLSGSLKNLTSDDQLNDIYRRPSSSKQTKQHSDTPTGGGATAGSSKHERCPICLDPFINKKQLNCKHEFCEECLQKAIKHNGPICPICKDVFGVMEGDQPDGTMTWIQCPTSLPGFPACGLILISYYIPSGKQTEKHPNPGEGYQGIIRTAYLPDNNEGNEVLKLLRKAFDQKLIFTVGTSRTTGMENQVIWNDISHKTSIYGGSESFGYPDPMYLSRVKEQLKDKGIK